MRIEITPEYLASQSLSPTFQKRFWKRVNKTESCWLWTGNCCVSKWGQKRGQLYGGKGNRHQGATRASWILHNGPIPHSKEVCHTCDNGMCVNPEHLWLGTHKENMHDMINKGRRANTAKNLFGENHPLHKLTEEEVKTIIGSLKMGATKASLARVYRVSETAIRLIQLGKNWKYLSHPAPPLENGDHPAFPAVLSPASVVDNPCNQ